MNFGDGGRTSKVERATNTNKGAEKASIVQLTMRVLLQMRPYKDDSIKGIDLGLDSAFDERWSRKASVRAATAVVKPGNGHARRSG